MKALPLLLLLLCGAACASTVTVEPGPGVTVKVTRNKTDAGKTIAVTVNKSDVVKVAPVVPIHDAMHGGIPVAPEALWPKPTVVTRSTPQLTSGNPIPPLAPPGDEGAWRLLCAWSKMGFDDPIVYPGQPGAAHHHTFFGAREIDAFTTTANIRALGNGTGCRGGSINLSGYWMPSPIDTKTGKPLPPRPLIVYYKNIMGGYLGRVMVNGKGEVPRTNVFPPGFRMIAGSPGRSAPATDPNPYASGLPGWGCFIEATGTFRAGTQGASIPTTCQPGDLLRAEITFPQCWDGINLDSTDHKSHVADLVRMPGSQVFYDPYKPLICPTSHPLYMPSIRFSAQWEIPPGVSLADVRLSSDVYAGPAGYSLHADWMNGHDPAIQAIWVRECLGGDRGYDGNGEPVPVTLRDCGSATLGDGRSLIEWDGN